MKLSTQKLFKAFLCLVFLALLPVFVVFKTRPVIIQKLVEAPTPAPLLKCPERPPGLVGRINVDKEKTSYEILSGRYFPNSPGGFFKPHGCKARNKTVIIVPYRDRQQHLMSFLNNIIPFLTKQQTEFAVFVIEPVKNVTFNRALLMNIGFLEALKTHDFDCFVFHDVDLLPTNDKNLYRCGDNPRHMSVANTKFKKRLPYTGYVGGVIGLSRSLYEKINGLSNLYFGWGAEDDDLYKRLKTVENMTLLRYPAEIGEYQALAHGKDKGNPKSGIRMPLLAASHLRHKTDGLNSLKYKVKKYMLKELYTWVLVDVDMKYYNNQITAERKKGQSIIALRQKAKPAVKRKNSNVLKVHNKPVPKVQHKPAPNITKKPAPIITSKPAPNIKNKSASIKSDVKKS